MLSKRIAGILKQYPNPEVAFFATEVLTGNATSVYLQSGFSRQRRSRGIPSNYLTPSNPPEDRYLGFSVDDPIEKINQTEWRYGPPLQGRELLRDDLRTISWGIPDGDSSLVFDTLGDAMQAWLKSGEWYNGTTLDQTINTEVMSLWVAVWVNRWLKAFSKLTTIGQLVDHYAEIEKLARSIGDLCDYVSEERIDPAHLTLNQLLHRSRRWHAAQRRDAMAAEAPPSERVYDRDKYGVFKLTTREALEHEGNFMNHCVGRYWKDVHDGVKDIYSVRNLDGQSVATVEVQDPRRRQFDRGGRVVQIKGPSNRAVTKPKELCDTVYYFLESIGATNRTGYCMQPSEARENPDEDAPGGYRPIFAVKTNLPDADLWIVRKGTPEKIGSVTKTFSPEHIGVQVMATDLVLPDYLYYVLVNIHARGFYQERMTGTLRLKHITTTDVKDALRLLRL